MARAIEVLNNQDPGGQRGSGLAIFTGSAICLGLIVLFTLLAVAGGLTLGRIGAGTMVLAGIAFALAFFAGGFASSRLLPSVHRAPFLHGAAVWAIVIVIGFYTVASQAMDFAKTMIIEASVGSFTTIQAQALLEQISEMEPRLVTDFQLKEGKAVTIMSIQPSRGPASAEIAQSAKQEKRFMRTYLDEMRGSSDELREAGQRWSWIGFSSSLLGLAATLAGSWVGQLSLKWKRQTESVDRLSSL